MVLVVWGEVYNHSRSTAILPRHALLPLLLEEAPDVRRAAAAAAAAAATSTAAVDPEPAAQGGGFPAVAGRAEGAQVLQAAGAAALGHGHNVVCLFRSPCGSMSKL